MISPLAYVDPSAKLGKNVTVHPFAYIDKNVEIGDDNEIMPYASLMSGARLSHDVEVGNKCIIGNGSHVSGNCIIEDCAILTSNVLMQGNTRLGSYAAVQGGCRFIKDIPPYIVAAHEPISFYSINTMVLEHCGFSSTIIKHIAQAYRILYKANTSQQDAVQRIREQIPSSPEIEHIIEFVEKL